MGQVTCAVCGVGCLYHGNPDVGECDGDIRAIYLTSEMFAHVCEAHVKFFRAGVSYGKSCSS